MSRRKKKNRATNIATIALPHGPTRATSKDSSKVGNKLGASTRSVLLFSLGAIFSLLLTAAFVRLVPGPKVSAKIREQKITSGNAAGCTIYSIFFSSDQAIDHLYAKVQFPRDIANYKVGVQEYQLPAGKSEVNVFEVGRGADGECRIVQAASEEVPGLETSKIGPAMVEFRASDIAPSWMAMSLFALSEKKVSIHPPPAKVTEEGSYEYEMLGLEIRKPLKFQDLGEVK